MKRGQSGDLINTVSPDIPESSDPWRSCGERLLQACHEKGSDVGSSPTGSARSDALKSMVFSISRQLADRLRWIGSSLYPIMKSSGATPDTPPAAPLP